MILVTGGAGFIGSNFILDWLAGRDEALVNLDKLSYAGRLQNLSALKGDPRHLFVQGDICDAALVNELFRTHQPRAIVHFAAESHVDRSILGPGEFIRTNIEGTFTLLQAALAHWRSLGPAGQASFRFLHISTDEVYGSLGPQDAGFTEAHPCLPNSPYAASKAAADQLVRAWHHTYGLPALTTNCSNNYGPNQFPEKLIPLMITHAVAGKDLPVYGDGLHVRDWLYVADHCRALRTVLDHGVPGQTYNVGGRSEMTNMQVVQTVCRLLDELRPRADGQSYAGQIRHVTDRLGHDRRYAVDCSKIERELGWRATESFDSGIRKTVQHVLAEQGVMA